MPRHPPYALKNLNTQNDQNKSQTNNKNNPKNPKRLPAQLSSFARDARVHCAVLKKQPGPPKPHPRQRERGPGPAIQRSPGLAPVPSGPNSVSNPPPTRHRRSHSPRIQRIPRRYLPAHTSGELSSQCSTSMSSHLTDARCQQWPPTQTPRARGRSRPVVLLRKEVIQPHLPVRLPCYDFVPIAGPTFDRSLPQGLGHGLRVLPTFVT